MGYPNRHIPASRSAGWRSAACFVHVRLLSSAPDLTDQCDVRPGNAHWLWLLSSPCTGPPLAPSSTDVTLQPTIIVGPSTH